tara:strand:+ start:309 stop:572 length:264 start_codon:yes stop_codon:yes gene_type:complete
VKPAKHPGEGDEQSQPSYSEEELLEVLSENVQTLPANSNHVASESTGVAGDGRSSRDSIVAFVKEAYLAVLLCILLAAMPNEQEDFY